MEKNKLHDTAAVLIVVFAGALLLNLTFKKLLPAALPLILALAVSSAVRPIAKFVGRKSRMPIKLCGGVIVVLSIFTIVYASVCLGSKLIHELTDFLSGATSDLESENNIIRQLLNFIESFPDRIPFLNKISGSIDSELYDSIYAFLVTALKEGAASLSTGATSFAAGFLLSLPKSVFAAVVSVISLFYLTVDYDNVKSTLSSLMPKGIHDKMQALGGSLSGVLFSYLKAYAALLALTFGELLFGFVILRIKYAFLLAAVIAVIDILPVLGAGCVLLPWTLVLFIVGEGGKAVGLLILFGIMYVVRQFAEPKIIGHLIGVHPLITLSAAYLAFRFFGLIGMFAAPITIYVVKEALEKSKE